MPISEKLRALIRSAWDDGAPCLVATQGPNGPNISPKGSMVVFDDEHLAYWERSKKQALDNLGSDKRVCVIYANFKAQRDGVLESGFLRFYGKAELHESGPVRDAIFKLLLPREQTHVGADPESVCWSRSIARATFAASRCLDGRPRSRPDAAEVIKEVRRGYRF